MFNRLSERIVRQLIRRNKLKSSDGEIYVYGMEVLILNLGLVMIFLLMSIVSGELFHFFCFIFFFIPLRIFAGGFHAKRSETCFVLSIYFYVLTIVLSKWIVKLTRIWWISIFVAMVAIIYTMAPVMNEKHQLAEEQFKRNRKIVHIVLLVHTLFWVLGLKYMQEMSNRETVFVCAVAVMLILEKYKTIPKEND